MADSRSRLSILQEKAAEILLEEKEERRKVEEEEARWNIEEGERRNNNLSSEEAESETDEDFKKKMYERALQKSKSVENELKLQIC